MDSETLIREIKEVFRDVPKPNRFAIADLDSLGPEAAWIQHYFGGKDFEKVTFDDIWKNYREVPSGCFYFMLPDAVHYYLPSYLIMCVEDFDRVAQNLIPETLIDMFVGRFRTFEMKAALERLSPEQRRVIAFFFRYIQKQGDRLHIFDKEQREDLDALVDQYSD